ncbi:MAG: 50S ribosomal protein L23 [Opitutales bacterium]|nr:50S ribosomal protein L23 [Opitutales bacterium]
MINPSKVLKESIVTEKAAALSANNNQYSFEVYPGTDKKEIAEAVEQMFKVNVVRVNVQNKKSVQKRSRMNRNQMGTKKGMKKAIVTLKQGDAIELV